MPLWGPKWKYGYSHICASWLTPPPSPVTTIPIFMSPVSNKPMGDIPDGYRHWLSDVFWKWWYSHFWPLWPLEIFYAGMARLNESFGDTIMGPWPFLGPNHNPEKRASSMKSTDPVLGQDLQDRFCRISKIFTGVSKGGGWRVHFYQIRKAWNLLCEVYIIFGHISCRT